ncbi:MULTISPECIES: lycopene beta-cyclase CrtY [Sphingobium]|uniref:Lycopene beta-cyclase CrtY n=1 Tax=Sphingobium tyrosinilyticum TaxID=2715436 RepID=A0ABV9EWB0_9SPHN|nr:lycopene beta-cyclase CrtY [Sphingobium sp. EP60837]ANI78059.1 Lycopene beta-cyclase [Sphingobium sp. EP60837]
MAQTFDCDLAILGGGLAGSLIALAFARLRPDIDLLLIERDQVLGGNHLWSFFDSDIRPADRWLIDPLVTHRWPQGHEVRFPTYRRVLDGGYNSIASAQLDAHVRHVLGDRVLLSTEVVVAAADHVTLSDGRNIRARAVLDARGGGDLSALDCGWQKFVGQALRLAHPHGLDRPVIMDATVDQFDGYRFVYLLPFGDRTIFVEDTYYSNSPALDLPVLADRIASYAAQQGWRVEDVVHQESGILPVVHGGDFDRFWPPEDSVPRAGVRAALFQPMTGYSLPDAVATALWLADQPLNSLATATRDRAAAHWRSGGYYRLLGKMLFLAAQPDQRWRIFDRFYRLSPHLIGRFYAGHSTWADRIRILCGRPPVPIRSAMRALLSPSA